MNEIEVLVNNEELKSQNRDKTVDLIEIESENETESPKQVEQPVEVVTSQSTSQQAQVNEEQVYEEIIQTENVDYRLAEQIQRTISDTEIENCVAHLNEETDRLLREKRNIDRLTGSIEKYILDDAKVCPFYLILNNTGLFKLFF